MKSADLALPPHEIIRQQTAHALAEDVGTGDLTASLLDVSSVSEVELICRQHAVLCGTAWFDETFRQLDPGISIDWQLHDGDTLSAGQAICTLKGNTRALLTGERTAMNYLQTLSGVATRARKYKEAVHGIDVMILDTRKTLPGLRLQQKYAVRCGGCSNHRIGLYDAILIKENHILAAGSISAALTAAQNLVSGRAIKIEIEVESLSELQEALDAGATVIMLDNFNLELLRQAVAINRARALLEASGGVNLQTIREIALTGVDAISVGDLTKDVTAVDLSMRFKPS